MANIVIPFAAVTLQPVPSAGFNNNFTEISTKFNTYAVQTDVAKTISVGHTFSVRQTIAGVTFTGDALFTDALFDIGKTGATRPRDLFLSRNLDVGGTTVHRGTVTFSADASFDIGAAGATRPRDLYLSSSINIGAGPATVGAVRLQNNANVAARNVGNTADIVLIKASTADTVQLANSQVTIAPATGNTVIGGNLTVNSGYVNPSIASGALNFTPSVSKIIPGATSVSFRDSTDTFDNFIVTNAGNATLRGNLNFASSTTKVAVPGGGAVDFRTAADASSALLISDTGVVQVSSGFLIATFGVRTLLSTNAALPAAGAARDGLLGLDTTNSRLIYWVGGLRYFIPIGTSF